MEKISPTVHYLKDYKASFYFVQNVELHFDLCIESTIVTSRVYYGTTLDKGTPESKEENLFLHGKDMELISIAKDGEILDSSKFSLSQEGLTIFKPGVKFCLEIKVRVNPKENQSLEGLYASKQCITTQCEPQGFRKITYFLDRPDILATYTVTMEADQKLYPTLLSNGNCVGRGELPGGRHWTKWEDPFKKPSYLFALCAGDFACLKETFHTKDGRDVSLEIYAAHQDIDKCAHAMLSLKNSLAWDEKVFGLICDLDEYKIVAIRDFNMGAMENKGLNIFNTALVIAKPEISTDYALQRVERVIGHEYFHNWTGNRVTCRDWFQLCLKEGLTVFRDSLFAEDMGSPSVVRIEDVKRLRALQFPEDKGPMSHPPRPDNFIEINNFYTMTVYEKGAEVVRMLRTLIGPEAFRRGMDLYFQKFDGMAVTQEDFVQTMSEASGKDLTQFMLWYTQAGTPLVSVRSEYNAQDKTYRLHVKQKVAPTPGQERKEPLHMPLVFSLFKGNQLRSFPLDPSLLLDSGLLELRREEETFTFYNIEHKPIPSLFRNFSAPVMLDYPYTDDELVFLMGHDTDPFNRWEAAQSLLTRAMLSMIEEHQRGKELHVPKVILDTFGKILRDVDDYALSALTLNLPTFSVLNQHMKVVDVDSIFYVRKLFKTKIAETHKDVLLSWYRKLHDPQDYSFTSLSIGKRMLKNTCLHFLGDLAEKDSMLQKIVKDQLEQSRSMTDILAALNILTQGSFSFAKEALHKFYETWRHEDEVIDSWFLAQALSDQDDVLTHVKKLLTHEAFDFKNPNRLRSLVSSFCHRNERHFHHVQGDGYKFCADYVIKLDAINPQVAATLVRAFLDWKRYDEKRKGLMERELLRIKQTENLSAQVYEIVHKALF